MQKKVNIGFLLVDQHSGQGGLEKVLNDVTKGLKELNINSTVILMHPPKHIDFIHNFENVSVMDLPKQRFKYVYQFLPKFVKHFLWKRSFKKISSTFLEKHIQQQKIDALVVLNLSKNLLRILPSLKKSKKRNPNLPFISWPHGTITTLKPSVLSTLQKEISIFDHFFAISKGLERELKSTFTTKVSLIYNPVKLAPKIPQNTNNFIYIGRIGSPDKRVKDLLNILKKLNGNWSLDLIGASDSKKDDQEILNHARDIDVLKNIKVHGWSDNPWSCVSSGAALLLNSKSEGFGLVLVEAMMRGIPCVSSNCPVGPEEIIIDNKNGWLFDLNDYDKCLSILQNIIDERLPLPSSDEIQETVQKFSAPIVINNFKNKILQEIKLKSHDI